MLAIILKGGVFVVFIWSTSNVPVAMTVVMAVGYGVLRIPRSVLRKLSLTSVGAFNSSLRSSVRRTTGLSHLAGSNASQKSHALDILHGKGQSLVA